MRLGTEIKLISKMLPSLFELAIRNSYLFYGSEIRFLLALKEPEMNNPR
jgi:hypothetical protein